jgi:dienelactone hydrolase
MKQKHLLFALIIGILTTLAFTSCREKHKKHVEQKPEEQVVVFDTTSAKGVVLPDVKARADSTISFALYLPEKYSIKQNMPVIFAFDAQARGKLPLEMYKELADKYGYILIGSNNSKNRTDWTANKEDIRKLMNDAFGRFAIDKQRVYTTGFSGGARVACLVALDLAKIQGVIGCAAGFPEFNNPAPNRFCYIGFSGNEDFNHAEMVKLDESLASAGFPYYISFYKGKHDWPKAEVMNEGFLWLEFDSYKNRLSARNETLIADFRKKMDAEISKAVRSNQKYEEYNLIRKEIAYLSGLTDLKALQSRMEELEQSETVKKAKNSEKDLLAKEVAKQEEYRNELNKGNLEWWKNEIGIIYKNAAKKDNSPETYMAKRLKNYISLIANLNATNALASKQTEAAAFFLAVYSMADPFNPDFFYLSAYFFARENKIDQSLMFLKNAVKAGFKDKKKLQTDETFDVLRNNKEFEKIVDGIKE